MTEDQFVESIVFSAEGRFLLAGAANGKIHKWDLAALGELNRSTGLNWDIELDEPVSEAKAFSAQIDWGELEKCEPETPRQDNVDAGQIDFN